VYPGEVSTSQLSRVNVNVICDFIAKLGDSYKPYARTLRALDVTEEMLLSMVKEETLVSAIGVKNVLHQAVFTEVIKGVLSDPNAFDKITTILSENKPNPGTLPFPKDGITMQGLDEFIMKCGGESALKDMTTTDVNMQAQMPLTFLCQASYCDMMKNTGHSGIEPAHVFISHAWKYVFLDVVNALRYHFRNKQNIVIWFDLFTNNQHVATTLTFDWWCTTFMEAIKSFGHVVMVLSPWNNPIPLTRAWCLFELYCTVHTGSKFEVAMSASEHTQFISDVCMDVGVVNKMIGDVDVRSSDAWNPDDKASIFEVVQRTVGFNEINKLVLERMRQWSIDTLLVALQNESVDEKRWCLQCRLGTLYMKQGRYDLARPQLLESLDRRKLALGENHSDTVSSMSCLAILYTEAGDHESALPLYEKCMETTMSQQGDDHPETLSSLHNLAAHYNNMRDYKAALHLYKRCLEIQESKLGDDDPDTLSTMNNLGGTLHNLGYNDAALEVYQKCLEGRRIKLKVEHPDTLLTMSNLAAVHKDRGEFEAALGLYLKCFELQKSKLGDDNPNTLKTMNSLAALYSDKDDYDLAIPLFLKCLDTQKREFGEDHPDTLTTMYNLASVYHSKGDHSSALPLYVRCLELEKRKLGERDPTTIRTMFSLANLYCELDDTDEIAAAEQLFLRCLELQRVTLGNDHQDTLSTMNNLAICYLNKDKNNLARPLLEECYDKRRQLLGDDHPDTVETFEVLEQC